MTSNTTEQSCVKCDKSAGNAACDGCEQWFCGEHFSEHRQELAKQMDNIRLEHDLFQQELIQEDSTHPLLNHINDWEQESIRKIQVAAQEARMNLQKYLNQNKQQLQVSLSQVTDELQSSRESDNYTEIDFKKWIEKLTIFRELLKQSLMVNITKDNKRQSIIRLIQFKQNQLPDSIAKLLKETEIITSTGYETIFTRYEKYKSIVNDILNRIEKRQYRSVSYDMVVSLDSLVKELSAHLLELGIAENTKCFYDLSLAVTSGKENTSKTAAWIQGHTNDHWVVSNDSHLFCAWREDKAYFLAIIDHICFQNCFTKTLQRLEIIFSK
ncbi:unnamed protein product [Adineta steineri]|uniref:B box-type domain-containing protein n=2 Tax=Adineta steineri TaxID=433720 RepID=A0A815SM84_9BILA|nr:unnamed protein product [Adineta steineri]